jgi:hypothetical protein
MAKLIPPYFKLNASYGEKKIFRLLRDQCFLQEYVIFHSLNISDHKHKKEGEADFVIIGPKGILVLEVKGSAQIIRRQGIWIYKNNDRYYETLESPFEQAKTNYYSITSSIKRHLGYKLDRMGGYGVIFPNTVFSEISSEWSDKTLLDENHLDNLEYFLINLLDYWKERNSSENMVIENNSITDVTGFLRGDFEVVESPLTVAKKTNEIINTLTKEQFKYLDLASENERLMIRGYAGTGKTLLAIEQAKRKASENNEVLFICFNRLLSIALYLQLRSWGKITVMTFDSYLMKLANDIAGDKRKIDINELREFIARNMEILDEKINKYDYLIVDEAQDLLSNLFLAVFEKVIDGGIANGRWSIFYDDEVQSRLYGSAEGASIIEMLSRYSTRLHLSSNCRNPRILAEKARDITSLPIPEELMVELPADPFQIEYYSDEQEEASLAARYILKTFAQGYSAQSIMLLFLDIDMTVIDMIYSLIREKVNSIVNLANYYPKYSDCLRFDLQNNNIGYCTSQAFKGLENDIIIICGLQKLNTLYEKSVLYTAMTRARVRTYLLCHNKMKSIMGELHA